MTANHLRDKDLDEYFEGTERPEFVLANEKHGIKHAQGEETIQYRPGPEHEAVTAVTDERVLFVVGDCQTPNTDVDHATSLPYTEIREVETSKGMLKSRLSITARTGDTYHFLVSGREDLTEVAAFVRHAVQYWVAVDRRLGDARERLTTIEDYLDAGDPDQATAAYRETRGLLDEARTQAADYRDGDHAMHRRIEQVETRLTLTEIRGHRTRAEQFVEDGDAARADGEYRDALDAYEQARTQYDRALDRADEIEHHDIEAIEDDRQALEDTIAQLEAEPLADAMETCERAVETEDPRRAVDRWSDALEACHTALSIVHQHDAFDGDVHSLRFQVEWAAGNLARAHRDCAAEYEDAGDEHRANRDDAAAREAYRRAHYHLEAVTDVASEFRSGAATAVESDLERIDVKLETVSLALDDD